jgi:hypothetical protein
VKSILVFVKTLKFILTNINLPMAIYCEFINLIIPISNIESVYTGGFIKFKEDNATGFNIGVLWHDDYLFREGAMNFSSLELRIKKWESLGLKGLFNVNGEQKWIDFCVFEGMFDGDNINCDWLLYDSKTRCAYMKDMPFGKIAFREK